MQHRVIVADLFCLGQGNVTVVSYWMILLFFTRVIASPPKMDLSYKENTNFVISPIIMNLLFFSFYKFSVNLQFTANRLISFLNTLSSEASTVKSYNVVHNLFITVLQLELHGCVHKRVVNGRGGVFHSIASMQMHLMFLIHKKQQIPLKEKNPLMDFLAEQDTQPHTD